MAAIVGLFYGIEPFVERFGEFASTLDIQRLIAESLAMKQDSAYFWC